MPFAQNWPKTAKTFWYTPWAKLKCAFFVVVVCLHLGLVFSRPSVRTGRVLRALRRTWLPSASKLLDGLIRQSRSWDHDRPHPSSLQFCVLCVACSWEQVCGFDRKLYFKNEGEIGPNKLLQRLLDMLPGTGKKWPIADLLTGASPVTIPETISGRIPVPVPFSVLKRRILSSYIYYNLRLTSFAGSFTFTRLSFVWLCHFWDVELQGLVSYQLFC